MASQPPTDDFAQVTAGGLPEDSSCSTMAGPEPILSISIAPPPESLIRGSSITPGSAANATSASPADSFILPDDKTVISKRPLASDSGLTPPTLTPTTSQHLGQTLIGKRLEHYELIEFVGGGGMGAVFRANDLRLGRTVAVKVLSRDQTDDETIRRFRNEAQSAARLDHPHIARVHYVGEDSGWNYIVFEFIDGMNLRDLVLQNGPLSIPDALSYTLQVADALQHAASRDVVHRDIKPSNVLLATDGHVKLVDMGLARLHQVETSSDDLTASGVTLGTFDYISPEQARDPRMADVRSDIYSLGCTLYFFLAGQPPFPEGTALQKLLKHNGDEPPDLRQFRTDLPAGVLAMLAKMLAKRPSQRQQTAAELIAEIVQIGRQNGYANLGQPVATTPLLLPAPSLWQQSLPILVPCVALVLLVLLVELVANRSREVDLAVPHPTFTEAPLPTQQALTALAKAKETKGSLIAGKIPARTAPVSSGKGSLTASSDVNPAVESNPAAPRAAEAGTNSGTTLAIAAPGSSKGANSTLPKDPSTADAPAGTEAAAGSSALIAGNPISTNIASTGGQSPPSIPPGSSGLIESSPLVSGGILGPVSLQGILRPEPMPAGRISSAVTTTVIPFASPGGVTPTRLAVVLENAASNSAPRPDLPPEVEIVRSLAAACSRAAELGLAEIELHFNGELREKAFSLSVAKQLSIKAAPGFRPTITFRPELVGLADERQMIRLVGGTSGRVSFQGIHFRLELPRDASTDWSLFAVHQLQSLELSDSVLTIADPLRAGSALHQRVGFFTLVPRRMSDAMKMPDEAAMMSAPTNLTLNRTIARGAAALLRLPDEIPVKLTWRQGLFISPERMIDTEGTSQKPSDFDSLEVDLDHVTAIMPQGLYRLTRRPGAPHHLKLDIQSNHTILYTTATAALFDFVDLPQLDDAKVAVRGEENCYPRTNPLYLRYTPLTRGESPQVFDFENRRKWSIENRPRVGIAWKKPQGDDFFAERPAQLQTKQDFVLDADAPNQAGFDPTQLPDITDELVSVSK